MKNSLQKPLLDHLFSYRNLHLSYFTGIPKPSLMNMLLWWLSSDSYHLHKSSEMLLNH